MVLIIPGLAFAQFVKTYPGTGEHATRMFEDSWPQPSDKDSNDVVIRYQVRTAHTDATGEWVSGIIYVLRVEAHGSMMANGLALRLASVQVSDLQSAHISKNGEPPTAIQPVAHGTMDGSQDAAFILYENVRDAFPGAAGGDFINTQHGDAVHLAENLELELQFKVPLHFSISRPPYDLFIFRSGNYPHQTHLPAFRGAGSGGLMDLFGTEDDCSNEVCMTPDGNVVDNIGRYYVNAQGLPWVLDYPGQSAWPKESVSVDQAFPQLSEWVESGGHTNTDWWLYGDPQYLFNLFAPPSVPSLFPGATWVLLGALAGLGALRLGRRR